MKFRFLSLYLLLIFSILTCDVRATHSSSGELSYRCLGSTFYEITYTFYSKCGGNPTADQIVLTSTNDCGFSTYTYIIPALNTYGEDYDITCDGNTTICNGGIYFGFKKNVFKDTINLYYQCAWTLGVNVYSRPNEITTIVSPDTLILYSFCMIDNRGGLCNNSPRFISPPNFIYCTNEILNIDNSVVDEENDSVTYSLIVPRTGPLPSDTVTYFSGYSYLQPIQSSVPMSFDVSNGNFIGIPNYNDVTIYAVLVNEYRNGVLIGQVERDAMFFVESCSNAYPSLTGFNGTPSSDLTVYTNQTNYFKVYSTDANVNDQTYIEYDSSIAGMSFFFSRGSRDTAYFSWMPTLAHTLSNPHSFILKVSDDSCPYTGSSYRKYNLNVETVVDVYETNPKEISIYPNPFNSEINIKFKDGIAKRSNFGISISDIQGRIVWKAQPFSSDVINLNYLEEGIYLLSLNSIEEEFHFKIIKD